MRFTIVYASATGYIEDIAEWLKVLFSGSELEDLDRIDFTIELEESEALICCTPTWNTGSETNRSGATWDQNIDIIPYLSLKNKLGPIVGLGDPAAFSKYFYDAMEELCKLFESSGARMIGDESFEQYIFDRSKSVVEVMFCGLPLD